MRLTYDAGATYGMGHARRMQALRRALEERAVACVLAPAAQRQSADAIFVDSYVHRADDRTHFRADWIGAIDDLVRELDVALLVEPAHSRESSEPKGARKTLRGLRFALVDPSVLGASPSDVAARPSTILVTAGAADPARLAAAIAVRLAELIPRCEILLAGPTEDRDPKVTRVETDQGLVAYLARSDVVVTAAGVTMLEALALGRPVVAIVAADNQSRYAQIADEAGAAIVVEAAGAPATVVRLLDDPDERMRLSANAKMLIDARGADRVADAIVSSLDL